MSTLYMESLGVATAAHELSVPISRKDQELARRFKRATDDAIEHVAEGMCSVGRAKRLEYGAALGSMKEAIACIRAAESVGYLRDGDGGLRSRLEKLADRLVEALAA